MVDLLEDANDAMAEWFDACETHGEIERLASEMYAQIDYILECRIGGQDEGRERRSWTVTSVMEDGDKRCDVLNACAAEEAAHRAASLGLGEVVHIEVRPRPWERSRR